VGGGRWVGVSWALGVGGYIVVVWRTEEYK